MPNIHARFIEFLLLIRAGVRIDGCPATTGGTGDTRPLSRAVIGSKPVSVKIAGTALKFVCFFI
jgi:hypothetical protein